MKKLTTLVFSLLWFCFEASSQDSRQWATYLGGTSDDYGYAIATDASGNVYLTGYTVSTSGIASAGSHKASYSPGPPDAFLIKFDSSGNRLWGTYFGGTGDDQATNIAVNKATGDVYIVGITYSVSGIASGGFDNTINSGSSASSDAFLAKFNSSGVFQWGTYYGGTSDDEGHAVAVDGLGNVYLAGQSASSTTTQVGSGGHQNTYSGSTDAFLVKFTASGVREWGSYYGGTSYDGARGLAVDALNNVYLAGHTASTSGVSSGGFQNNNGGGRDAFLIKFNSTGSRLWGTFYGGAGYEEGHSVVVDGWGDVYFSGITSTATSGVISTLGSFQPSIGGGTYDAFLVKLDSSGTNRKWATYYGGNAFELFSRVARDRDNNIYLGGFTQSPSGISSGGFQNTYGGSNDGYLAKFTSGGSRVNASYYGGSGIECTYAAGVAPDDFGHVYFAGETGSATDVASGGHQNTYGGGSYDAFLVKFGAAAVACSGVSVAASPKDSTACKGSPVSFSVTASGTPAPSFQWRKNGVNINGANSSTYTINAVATTDTGSYDVMVKNACDSSASSSARLTINEATHPNIGAGDTTVCFGDSTQVCAATIFIAYSWNNGETDQCFYVRAGGNYWVSVTDVNGCSAVSDTVQILFYSPVIALINASNDTLRASAAVGYQWFFEGNELNGATAQTHIATQDGNYSVEITDANGCTARSADFYYSITGTGDLQLENIPEVIPNPASSFVIYLRTTSSTSKYSLYDTTGKLVGVGSTKGPRTPIDISYLSPGVYFVLSDGRAVRWVKQ